MCGRFTSTTPASALAAWFDAETDLPDVPANYNVTPTSDVHVVIDDPTGHRRIESMFWGLVPGWAESPAIGSRLINARSETVAVKPSFRSAFRKRRCLIPVDGFYEWVTVPECSKKQPVFISGVDAQPLAFAGIWEEWSRMPDRTDVLRSCSIITGPPNDLIAPLHDRMPMILAQSTWDAWLDVESTVEELQDMLRPSPSSDLQWWPVSVRVNNVRNHDSSLIEPVEITPDGEAEGQGRLL